MKELITIATAFIIVVALALFLYISTEKHSTSIIEINKMDEVITKNNERYDEMKVELEALKAHVFEMDSIYHKNK